MAIVGPQRVAGVSDTASRRKIFACWRTRGPMRWPRASPRSWLRLADVEQILPDAILYPAAPAAA